jgi:hypothetical protein
MSADARMPVSIIVERRKSQHPWQDHVWRPIGVLPRAETEGYLVNLSQVPPVVYVVLRRGETTDEMEIEPFHATVCPYEAMSYGESGEEIVEGVPMPTEVHDWVKEFVATHHVEAPFVKRKKSGRATPDAQPPRSPRPEEFS